MATVAVLGIGLLGRGMAENLVRQGHRVQVWNRTPEKCAPVVALGAIRGEHPAMAASGAERVHLVLSEDDAVDAVIAALRPGLGPDVPVIDHSTNLPTAVATRSERLRSESIRYLHAPVFMGPSHARDGTGLMLISGPTPEVEALRPALEQMTGRLQHLGDRPDKAAAVKLTGNGMLVMLAAAMGDLFRIGLANGVPPDEVIALFEAFAPTAPATGRRVMAAGTGPASFELTMARKDTRLMIEAAGGPEGLLLLPAVADAMDRALAAGKGAQDYGIFAKPDPG